MANAHFRARTFGTEGDGNAFIGLDIENESVVLNVSITKNDVRCTFELNDDFGAALGEALAGTKIKGNAGPALFIDLQLHRYKTLRSRVGIDAGFLPIPR